MESASESCAAIHGFLEGRIPDQKLVVAGVSDENKLFPKVLLPPSQCINSDDHTADIADIIQTISNNKEWIQDQLMQHGALLFRGFAVRTAADFRSFVEAYGWDEQRYMGFPYRTKVEDRVYTTNEAPLHEQIQFHHEMSLMKVWPSKLFFFCETAPPEGGQTAIALSERIVKRMEDRIPEFVNRLKNVGLVFKITTSADSSRTSFIAKNWQNALETNDPSEAKKRAVEMMGCSSFECYEDGSAEFVFGPMDAIRSFDGYGGRPVWFNNIVGYGGGNRNQSLSMGDGCGIPDEALDAFKTVVNEECVNLKWEAGDVLLLDNMAVQHARRPSKPPRRILIAMCKMLPMIFCGSSA
eukprot:PITA_01219